MVKISKKVEYTLMILKELSSQDSLLSAREFSDKFMIPFDTCSKILQTLVKQKIVSSAQGAQGGYKIIYDLSQLNYLVLSEMVEKKSFKHDCEASNCCLINNCNIVTPIKNLNNYLVDLFKNIKISDLLNNEINRSAL